MADSEFNRRDFNRLTLAAFGGIVAGTIAGCAGEGDDGAGGGDGGGTGGGTGAGGGATSETPPVDAGDDTAAVDPSLLAEEPHVCRGLNTCENKGKSGENACAGQGTCATATAHSCHGMNECKGQGGCEDTAGKNTCEGKGACSVPLGEETWTKVRAQFEEQMKAAGTEVGPAPAG